MSTSSEPKSSECSAPDTGELLKESLQKLSAGELQKLYRTLKEKQTRESRNRITTFFDTPEIRAQYAKHLTFLKAGAKWKERAFIAANRVGKTVAGGFEMALHLTGEYPDWWEGRRFEEPVNAWAAGKTSKTVRDIIQELMLGKVGSQESLGTGMIPADKIIRTTTKHGLADAVETVYVRHKTGGVSTLQFKAYEQGRDAYEGTSQQVIWLDEEPDESIYSECLTRTATTRGIIYITATPLEGLTDVILAFLPGLSPAVEDADDGPDATTTKFAVQAGWDDVPHIPEEEKAALRASYAPWQVDARTKGIPMLGSGAIYQVPESDFSCEPFIIPKFWPRSFGMDVGWNRTAVVWTAHDRDTGTLYVYDEYYRGQAEPSVHAAAIKNRGAWIPGAIDPAARGRSQVDGAQLLELYLELGLDIEKADNTREAGIYAVWERLSQGRLKVFRTCANTLSEYRLYRRDEKGQIVKKNDHLMDALRYNVMTGVARGIVEPNTIPGQEWWHYTPPPVWAG